GDGARFAPLAESLVVGDWNGDGFDDLVYQGVCGDGGALCWRAHISDNGRFVAADWGPLPGLAGEAKARAADLDGDGRDDLLYPAGCESGVWWHGQLSTGRYFFHPM